MELDLCTSNNDDVDFRQIISQFCDKAHVYV